jgi:hypothetical protein
MADPIFDFMTITTGNGPIHAAKVSFGQYVGTVPTAFGLKGAPCHHDKMLPEPALPAPVHPCNVDLDVMHLSWESTLRN